MRPETVLAEATIVARRFAAERSERQQRRHLAPTDFADLREAGVLATGLPVEHGGLWTDLARSGRTICEIMRVLARGDPSVALVAAMHPTVLVSWLAVENAPAPYSGAWRAQRSDVFRTVRDGAWWGTIKSEPGSGGDLARTKAIAHLRAAPHAYHLTGTKHFGTGAGIVSYMVTTAVVDDEHGPELFFMDVRDAPWDGTTGMQLTSAWQGRGMAATQSHAFRFEAFPATRLAWPQGNEATAAPLETIGNATFTAVGVGIVQAAIDAAREILEPRSDTLRPYERVEWTRARTEAWLVEQAYEGMLRAIETRGADVLTSLRAKTAVAELGPQILERLCRVVGGSSYAGTTPFPTWADDARALGFLRPPWGLAFDRLGAAERHDAKHPD